MNGEMRKVRPGALTAFLAVACAAITPFCALAQSPATNEKPLAFEIVSIREDSSPKPGEEIAVTQDGWHMAHGSLMAPLLTARPLRSPEFPTGCGRSCMTLTQE